MTISKPLINLFQNYKTRGVSAAQARVGVNYAIDAKTIYLGPLPCLWKKISRPYLQYPPSLHALKDWWDKYDITWFLRGGAGGEQVIKSAKNRKRGRVCLFQTTENEQLFILKTITENYGWKWSLLLFWMSSNRKYSHTSKNYVKLVETRTVHFAWLLNRRFCFERTNKPDGDFLYCTPWRRSYPINLYLGWFSENRTRSRPAK